MTNRNENSEIRTEKKAWQPLKLETLDVASATKSGTNRLDPAETFVFYRPS